MQLVNVGTTVCIFMCCFIALLPVVLHPAGRIVLWKREMCYCSALIFEGTVLVSVAVN